VTHRDVLENGFLLKASESLTPSNDAAAPDLVTPNSIDAVFLDLPSPQLAVKHAYEVLRSKGRLCNFSPCIEQVQKASQEMARLGFYDIRTFECLSREINVKPFFYDPINEATIASELKQANIAS